MRLVFWIQLLALLANCFGADLPSQQQPDQVDEEDELDKCLKNNKAPLTNRTVVNLGYLTAVKGDLRNR